MVDPAQPPLSFSSARERFTATGSSRTGGYTADIHADQHRYTGRQQLQEPVYIVSRQESYDTLPQRSREESEEYLYRKIPRELNEPTRSRQQSEEQERIRQQAEEYFYKRSRSEPEEHLTRIVKVDQYKKKKQIAAEEYYSTRSRREPEQHFYRDSSQELDREQQSRQDSDADISRGSCQNLNYHSEKNISRHDSDKHLCRNTRQELDEHYSRQHEQETEEYLSRQRQQDLDEYFSRQREQQTEEYLSRQRQQDLDEYFSKKRQQETEGHLSRKRQHEIESKQQTEEYLSRQRQQDLDEYFSKKRQQETEGHLSRKRQHEIEERFNRQRQQEIEDHYSRKRQQEVEEHLSRKRQQEVEERLDRQRQQEIEDYYSKKRQQEIEEHLNRQRQQEIEDFYSRKRQQEIDDHYRWQRQQEIDEHFNRKRQQHIDEHYSRRHQIELDDNIYQRSVSPVHRSPVNRSFHTSPTSPTYLRRHSPPSFEVPFPRGYPVPKASTVGEASLPTARSTQRESATSEVSLPWDHPGPFDLRLKRRAVASPDRSLKRVARTVAKDLTDCVAISKNAATADPDEDVEASLPLTLTLALSRESATKPPPLCRESVGMPPLSSLSSERVALPPGESFTSISSPTNESTLPSQVKFDLGYHGSRGRLTSTSSSTGLSSSLPPLEKWSESAGTSSFSSSGYQSSAASLCGKLSSTSLRSSSLVSETSQGYQPASSAPGGPGGSFTGRASLSSSASIGFNSSSSLASLDSQEGSSVDKLPLRRVRYSSVSLSASPLNCPTPEPASKAGRLADYLADCLLKYGVCIVDSYMGQRSGLRILKDVKERANQLHEGRLMTDELDSQAVRGDETMWLEAGSSPNIDNLVQRLDMVMRGLAHRLDTTYQITSRTKAMVARYSGAGKCYVRHVDNHRQDGRCITCIYYLNQNYNSETAGGMLRMYPSRLAQSIDIEPKFDRVIFFWSDHRTPHEVLPAFEERYAITVWYFDEIERQQAKQRMTTSSERFAFNQQAP